MGDIRGIMRIRWRLTALACLFTLLLSFAVSAASSGPAEQTKGLPEVRPDRGTVLWYDDLESGAPGWSHGDFTAITPQFHKDTYLAYSGGTSWWCGNRTIDADGGYGNQWDHSLLIPDIDMSLFTDWPMLTFQYRVDSEVAYDFTHIQVEEGGVLATKHSFDGKVPWTDAGVGYSLAGADDPLSVRFRFVSDGAYSDEDGYYLSFGGAFMCDNINIYDWATGASLPFFFDTAEPGCTDSCIPAVNSAGDYWHLATSPCHAASGDHYWACTAVDTPGYIPPGTNFWLRTPFVDISEYELGDSLRFVYAEQFFVPDWFDGWKEEITVDGGVTWHQVGWYYGDQSDTAGLDRGPCERAYYNNELTDYLPGTSAAQRWTMYTGDDGGGPNAVGEAGITLDSVWLEEMESHTQVWNVPGVVPTIQQAVDVAANGDVVVVAPGTYNETVHVPAHFSGCTLVGEGGARAYAYITGGMTLADGLDGFAMSNLYITGSAAGSSIVRLLGSVSNLTMTDCVLDGEMTVGRHGFAGGQLEQDATVSGCEFKDILGWALFESRSGSGGGGSPLGTIVFDNNYVHDSNGAVVFRGEETDWTDQVSIYGNTWSNIGGNAALVGDAWAAFEVNRAELVEVYENVVTGVSENSWGEGEAGQFWDITTLDVHHNVFNDNWQGLWVAGDPSPGGVVEYNSISGNTDYGVQVDGTGTPFDAELNWWGDASGPATSKGTGDKALGNIDYDPWIGATGGENIVCVPDYDELSIGHPDTIIDVNYLGGGGGRVFGYTMTLSWDGSLVATSPGSIIEGDLLSSIDNTFWFVRSTGTYEITIDCIILGTQPGAWGPGTMFSVPFTAVAAVPYGVSPVDITVDRVRDEYNNTLSGFFAADGEIVVDTVAPSVANVLIENTTLAHTDDYIKDGDGAEVTADVSDAHPSFGLTDIVADLTALGGGATVNPDTYAGGVATWTLGSVTCTPSDGTATVTVSATDAHGNNASDDDDIIADNTDPLPVTDFDASPGHEECALTWVNGTDTYWAGVEVRRYGEPGEYPEYPWHVVNYPSAVKYPADELSSTGIYDSTGTGHTDAVVDRNIYYYQAFCYDRARNYGPAATTARDLATNYWLGDVPNTWSSWLADGVVNDGDILELSGSYWLIFPTGFGTPCDVGPTVHPDGSRVGVPKPDDRVEFEDAMIFAMNYGVVAPRVVPFLPEPYEPAPLALALGGSESRGDDIEIALRLEGNSGEVKGLSASLVYDSSELEFVSARLANDVSSPLGEMFFMHRAEDERVDLDAVVLGTDVTIGGCGDLAVLTFRALSDQYTLEINEARVRDADNGELAAKLGDLESSGELPVAFRLVGNTPNPFNPVTKIAYHVPHESDVTIRVYDVAGRIVATLVDGASDPGRHVAVWNGTNDQGEEVGSGVYFCTMEAPDFHDSRKMTLLK